MLQSSPDIATIMRTLADPTRRAVYERLVDVGEAAVIELTRHGTVSQPAVSQHLKALRTAGLVTERRNGRTTRYSPTPQGLTPLIDWIGVYGLFWRDRFTALKSVLKEIDPQMTALARDIATRAIVVEDTVPHTPETVWRVLTTPELVNRWMMKNNFTPGLGQKFTMQAHPMGDWDGTVACEVTAFDPPKLLSYTWVGGSIKNPTIGSALDSIVTWTLTPVPGGTRVRMVHDGFRSPQNDAGYDAMSGGWGTVIRRISEVAGELG